jgi:hypothetical protein
MICKPSLRGGRKTPGSANFFFRLALGALLAGWLGVGALAGEPAGLPGAGPCAALTNATIVIIRHAEKPDTGFDLAPAGTRRADAYVHFFQSLTLDGHPFKPDHLFCTADSKGSHRPRLTLEPLSRALQLPLDHRFANKDTAEFGRELRSQPHGQNLLICWHHGEIPTLLTALGADPARVLPQAQWPEAVFGWMIELHYDATGRLQTAQCLPQNLMPDDAPPPPHHEPQP